MYADLRRICPITHDENIVKTAEAACAGCPFEDWGCRRGFCNEPFMPEPSFVTIAHNTYMTHACSEVARTLKRRGAVEVDGVIMNPAAVIFADDPENILNRTMSRREFERLTVYAVDANARIPRGESLLIDGDYYTRAARKRAVICSYCGRLTFDSEYTLPNGSHLCATCYDEPNAYISSYHASRSSGYPTIGDAPFIGFELEVEAYDEPGYLADGARAAYDICGEAIRIEHDSSLEDGFEIIGMPHSADALAAFPFETLTAELRALYFRSHNGGNCGFHLHFSREWFGKDEPEQIKRVARIIRMYKANSYALARLSRRNETRNTYCDFDEDTYTIERATCHADIIRGKIGGSRYAPINLNNWLSLGTIEFRLGRGSLKASSLRAWIDMHIAFAKNSKRLTDRDSLRDWLYGISGATRDYIASRDITL